ncbi:MAG: hypothetical protein WC167_00355 [Bacilli bacterium]|jgi:hypothetical protein
MILIKDANRKVKEYIYRDNVQAAYKETVEKAKKGNKHSFALSMQVLITKVGFIIEEVVISPKKKGEDTCYVGMSYLCQRILKDKSLFQALKSTGINYFGNDVKHGLDDIDIDINNCLIQYNRLIKALVAKLEIPSLATLEIKVRSKQKERNKKALKAIGRISPMDKSNISSSSFTVRDGNKKLSVSILPGDGIVFRGGFLRPKKKYLNFNLSVKYQGEGKVKRIIATIPIKPAGEKQIVLKNKITNLELETDKFFFPNIRITVNAKIKLRLFKTKTMKCWVSKNFQ